MTPDSQHNTANELVALAHDRFSTLSRAEENALLAAAKGTLAVCGPNEQFNHPANDPAGAGKWPADREIRASLIRWMCVDRLARDRIDPKGIAILGAKVVGKLDLTHTSPPFEIVLRRCQLEDAELASADLPELSLEGSWVRRLMADNIRVHGSLWLNNGFRADRVHMIGAQIGRDLECADSVFSNPSEIGLGADRITVKGSVILKRSRIDGELRLHSAQIGSELSCVGATLNGEKTGLALVADRIDVGGSVVLRDDFHANGQVRFLNAKIGGDLTLRGGIIANPSGSTPNSGIAFNADRMNVKGSVFFRDGFQADGLVVFNAAHIGSNLEFDHSVFNSPSGEVLGDTGTALDVEGIRVEGSVLFHNGFSAKGRVRLPYIVVVRGFEWRGIAHPDETSVDLSNASVGTLDDELQSWPPMGKLELDGFTYARISSPNKDVKARLAWIARQQPFTPQPYRQFAKILRDEGDEDSARKVLFETERLRSKEWDKTWLARLWSGAKRLTIGFGYRPEWAAYWLLGFIILGMILFNGGFSAGGIVPVDKDAYGTFKQFSQLPPHYARFNALVYSLENSVPLFRLGQADSWQADPDPQWQQRTLAWLSPRFARAFPPAVLRCFRFGRTIFCWVISPTFLRGFRAAQILVGWFLTTMFVLAVTGLVRKD